MNIGRRTRPHLIRTRIVEMLAPLVERTDERMLNRLPRADALSVYDLIAAYRVARQAHTILFSTEQALALLPALERFTAALAHHHLPFPATILQFTTPIAEADLLPYPEVLPDPVAAATTDDHILALLLSQEEAEDGTLLNTAGAWFQSGAVNRVAWPNDPHAHLELPDPDLPDAAGRLANKQALRALAIACIAYINCENITLAHQPADAKLNRSRISKGKKPFDDYHLCRLVTRRGQEGGEPAEAGHGPGHRFDVRGHFRRLPNGKLTWVRAHQRGLAHELYVPSVQKVA
jgi:hypothetical protein